MGMLMNCANCGKANDDSFRYCQFCGSRLTPPSEENEKISLDLPEAVVSTPQSLDTWLDDDIDNRRAAGNDEADNSWLGQSNAAITPVDLDFNAEPEEVPADDGKTQIDVCPEQDAEISDGSTSAKRYCRQCGGEILPGYRFCGACGARFEEDAVSGTPNPAPGTPTVEMQWQKRSVERTSFISKHAQASVAGTPACFSLNHLNDDGSAGEEIPLFEGDNIIGRLNIPNLTSDRFLSPKHIVIRCKKNHATLTDLDSLNGTFLRISNAEAPLHDGDVFRIGEELLCFQAGNSSQPILNNHTAETTRLLGGCETEGWGYLRLILGAFTEGNVYRLVADSVTLGRTHADILFERDAFVSGTHARIQNNHGDYAICDVGSSNGTFLKLTAPLPIADTTYFLIGNQLMRIAPIRQ